VKFSPLTMAEIRDCMADQKGEEEEEEEIEIGGLRSMLEEESLDVEICDNRDDTVLFYVAETQLKQLQSCAKCASVVCKATAQPEVIFNDNEPTEHEESTLREKFLQQVNRGGFVTPSDVMFLFCLHADKLKTVLFADENAKKAFLACSSPKNAFAALLLLKLEEREGFLFPNECELGHSLKATWKKSARSFCNCVFKNFVAEVNDREHAKRKRQEKGDGKSSCNRKIKKLQG